MGLRIELQSMRVTDPNATFDRGVAFELWTTDPRTYVASSEPYRTREVAESAAEGIMEQVRTGGGLTYDLALQPHTGKYHAIIIGTDGAWAASTAGFDRPEDVRGLMELLSQHAQTELIEIIPPPDW